MDAGVEIRVRTRLGELTALRWGGPDRPPLLALHGWLDNAASFTRLAPLLASRHCVIAMDLPGHGHSAHLPAQALRYHLVDQVDRVLDFADALGLDRFDLLGHSLGAGIAALTAAAAPARIGKLALIEGLGPLADDGSKTLARWRDAQARPTHGHRSRTFANLDEAVAARVAAGGLRPDDARPIVERNLRATDAGFAWRTDVRLRSMTPVRLGEAQACALLDGIECPTLLLLARPTTPYLPAAVMQARAAHVADIRVLHLAGPHHLHVRHPQQVSTRVLDFLSA